MWSGNKDCNLTRCMTTHLQQKLTIEGGTLSGFAMTLPPAPAVVTLGRSEQSWIRFDPKLDKLVGRNHARVEIRQDGVFLIDLCSANGTFRSGQPVRGEVRIHDRDRFHLGGEGGPFVGFSLPAASSVVDATVFIQPTPPPMTRTAPNSARPSSIAAAIAPPLPVAQPTLQAPLTGQVVLFAGLLLACCLVGLSVGIFAPWRSPDQVETRSE